MPLRYFKRDAMCKICDFRQCCENRCASQIMTQDKVIYHAPPGVARFRATTENRRAISNRIALQTDQLIKLIL